MADSDEISIARRSTRNARDQSNRRRGRVSTSQTAADHDERRSSALSFQAFSSSTIMYSLPVRDSPHGHLMLHHEMLVMSILRRTDRRNSDELAAIDSLFVLIAGSCHPMRSSS